MIGKLAIGILLAGGLAAGAAVAGDVGGRPFYATLTGAAERPGPGDADGSGTAKVTINPGQSKVCWDLSVSGIAPATMAHIHIGGVEDAGGVVVTLTPPTGGTSSGCADDPDAAAILANPGGYYVNVHNADFPAGALRGQLMVKKAK